MTVQRPSIEFAAAARGQIAYQVVGDAPTTLVVLPPLAQNIEKMWEQPSFWRPITRLAGAVRFVHYDKLGTGLSDPVAIASSIEERLDELRAVVSRAGSDRVWLLGLSEGGMIAVAAAALLPDLVEGLVLLNTTAGAGAFPRVRDFGEVPDPQETLAFFTDVADRWATPESLVLPRFGPSLQAVPGIERWMPAYERASASPAMIHTVVASGLALDVTPYLPRVTQPTIVMHHRDDSVIPVAHGRLLAASIEQASYREVPGNDHFAWVAASADAVIDDFLGFMGVDTAGPRSDRILDPWDTLTPAERRVARLAQRGMTNREIAAELGVSLRTVETQLTRCYAKLHIRSRTELAILPET